MKNILWLTRVHPSVGRRKEFNLIPRKIKTKTKQKIQGWGFMRGTFMEMHQPH